MKEIVVISGKGGTGKTSIVYSPAVLIDEIVKECDKAAIFQRRFVIYGKRN